MRSAARSLVVVALAAVCGACSPRGADADPAADVERVATSKGGVDVALALTPKQPRLSDEPKLEVTIAADPSITVKPPSPPSSLGGFVVRAYDEPPATVDADRRVTTLRFTLEPETIGRHVIPPIELSCADPRPGAEHAEFTIATPELAVEVTSVLASEPATLDRLRGPGAPLPVVARTPILPWIAAAAGVLALAVAVIVGLKKRRSRVEAPIVRSPQELAADEFRALAHAGFLMRGDLAGFYVELTAVVRRYIERTTSIRAPEQTTAEFLRAMRGHPAFDADQQARLKAFLEAADLVKFAAVRPGREAVDASFVRGQQFVGLDASVPLEAAA